MGQFPFVDQLAPIELPSRILTIQFQPSKGETRIRLQQPKSEDRQAIFNADSEFTACSHYFVVDISIDNGNGQCVLQLVGI